MHRCTCLLFSVSLLAFYLAAPALFYPASGHLAEDSTAPPCHSVLGCESKGGNTEKIDAKIAARSKNSATAPLSAGTEGSGGSSQPCPAQQSTYTGLVPAWAPSRHLCWPVVPARAVTPPGTDLSAHRVVPGQVSAPASPPQPCLGLTSPPPAWSHSGPAPAAMGWEELGWGVRGSCQKLSRVSRVSPRWGQPGVLGSERSGDPSSHPFSWQEDALGSVPGHRGSSRLSCVQFIRHCDAKEPPEEAPASGRLYDLAVNLCCAEELSPVPQMKAG